MDFSFAVLGGDLRQYYLARYLKNSGYSVICHDVMNIENASALHDAVKRSLVTIGPVPFNNLKNSKELPEIMLPGQALMGGGIPKEIRERCRDKAIACYDFMESERLKEANAALTAEGLIGAVILATPFAIKGSRALVIGYGHCGSAISGTLNALGSRVTVYDNAPEKAALAEAQGFSAIPVNAVNHTDLAGYALLINTVPARVLDDAQLARLDKDCGVFDIASEPGGFGEGGIVKPVKLPGIPGRTAPETAGGIIGEDIIGYLIDSGFIKQH